MPSLLRPALRMLLAAFALSLLAVSSAHAQGAVEVTIKPPKDGEPATILTTDVTGDITGTYKIATPGGGGQTVNVVKGVSLRQLLEKTGTDVNFETISVPRTDGSKLLITRDQIEDPRNQAVFYVDAAGTTNFIGPREPGASAVAAENFFPLGSAVTFTQESESPLQVSISPSKKKIKLGGSVSFQASVKGNDGGDSLAYVWWISGKKQSQTSSPRFTQKFPSKDGVYKFSVSVRIEGSAVSQTAVAKITVGDPDKADQEQTGNGNATDGSDTGTGTGTGSGSGTDSGSTYTPSYTPSTPSAPVTPPTPTPPPPSTEPPKLPDIATDGTTVEGNLLADVSDPPPSNILESAARAAREGKQEDDGSHDGDAGVSEAALSIGGLLALLGLGAGIETRQGRLPRMRLPRRAA